MNNKIDLRSDTVTRPSPAMLEAMMKAEVGDDVFGDDPTVLELEKKTAQMFGKDDAIFCPSGTMTNQIAIKAHTQPGDEVICDITSHIYHYEGGGIAFNSGCSIKFVDGDKGRMKPAQVVACINPDDVHHPHTALVVAENTSNRGGGSIYNFDDLEEISKVCRQYKLKYHLDGARLFNAIVETGKEPQDFGKIFDSVSICFSKGLGAPVGSVLIGNDEFIYKARRIRKAFGGGMRQSGYLAAAAIYAVDNNIQRLKEDHRRAKKLGSVLASLDYVKEVTPVQTNIVIFSLHQRCTEIEFLALLENEGILAVGFGPQKVRFVTHLDFNDEMLDKTCKILKKILY